MKNPLLKRLPRELRGDFGKYATIFILLTLTISFVSGFLVADNSMITAYNESFEKYNVEDGHFRVQNALNKGQIKRIENADIDLYELFYHDIPFDNGTVLRIFAQRTEVNKVCLMEGEFPGKSDEIAIDRMFADNNRIRPGDTLVSSGKAWTVSGLVAMSDYSTMFENNNDTMFDAVQFGTAIVTNETFDTFPDTALRYCYAWKYDTFPEDTKAEREISEKLMSHINNVSPLEDYVPRYMNQAIMFTGDDMGSDKVMMEVLMYIVIVIVAFVFRITINDTIAKEAAVIGTLRATGFTKNEMIRHYMAMPLIVTLISAVTGNIIGYTYMKDFCADMYYGSYSLPTYVTLYNAEAFVKTTVIPILIMAAVTYLSLWSRLRLSPIRFLRNDLSSRKNRKAMKLPYSIPFVQRFHLRILMQNRANYLILALGIFFANVLLMFGMALPPLMKHFEENIKESMFCKYQYILQIPVSAADENHKLESMVNMMMFARKMETENPDAEKFTAYSLKTEKKPGYREEEVMFYGISDRTRYFQQKPGPDDFYVSSLMADKYQITEGDTFRFHESYGDKTYEFTVTGICPYDGAIAVFMDRKTMNRVFDLGEETFSGYFSSTEITDIDQSCISAVIDAESLTKVSRQLMVSMGSLMYLVDGFSVIIFIVLIYILSKIIIEKNTQSISMIKILGCTDREVRTLYLRLTAVVTLFLMTVSLPIVYFVLIEIFRVMLAEMMTGWMPLYISRETMFRIAALGWISYGAVALFEFHKIRRIPMDEALKNVE
ncbi:MAG: ABC transporter permease [Solobacterium sp.]|nr:ABC transporter permease [Solobacterium sp.]